MARTSELVITRSWSISHSGLESLLVVAAFIGLIAITVLTQSLQLLEQCKFVVTHLTRSRMLSSVQKDCGFVKPQLTDEVVVNARGASENGTELFDVLSHV